MTAPDHFEAFGRAAAALSDPTVIAGRYGFQRTDEQAILGDIVDKLGLAPEDTLLEIGCGTGNLLRPLAELVSEAVGVDHTHCLSALRQIGLPGNVDLVPGRWPDATVDRAFTKVLAYSVLHYLPGPDEAIAFVDAAVDALSPGGRALFGDLPNADARHRFEDTAYGKRFAERWRTRTSVESSDEDRRRDEILGMAAELTPYLSDEFMASVFTRFRVRGFEVYVLPQPPDLPFSFTREDVLIVSRP